VGSLLRYRNRGLGVAELEYLRGLVASGVFRSRCELARAVCEAWDWRQANGNLSLYACRDLLMRLAEWGHLELPAYQRRDGHRARAPVLPAELIALPWVPVDGRDADLDALEVRPIQPEERVGWRLFMGRYHYLGDRPIVGEHLLYAAFLSGELVALIGWASAALHVPARERYIGWGRQAKARNLHRVVNNIRFLVPPWVRVKHLASKVLALNLRRLSRDWAAAWKHPVLLAETFVDERRFRGTCYRAANWVRLGLTAGRTRRANAYLHQGAPKALYLYELHRRARQLLCEES
jgi:hypothetical protein